MTMVTQIIGERERANLVVQLARFFYISHTSLYLSGRCTYRNVLRTSKYALHEKNAAPTCSISPDKKQFSGWCPDKPLSCCGIYIHGFGVPHSERTAYTGRWGYPISRGLRPTTSDGLASESTEARERTCRRELLTSETAEERERRLSQRRV